MADGREDEEASICLKAPGMSQLLRYWTQTHMIRVQFLLRSTGTDDGWLKAAGPLHFLAGDCEAK